MLTQFFLSVSSISATTRRPRGCGFLLLLTILALLRQPVAWGFTPTGRTSRLSSFPERQTTNKRASSLPILSLSSLSAVPARATLETTKQFFLATVKNFGIGVQEVSDNWVPISVACFGVSLLVTTCFYVYHLFMVNVRKQTWQHLAPFIEGFLKVEYAIIFCNRWLWYLPILRLRSFRNKTFNALVRFSDQKLPPNSSLQNVFLWMLDKIGAVLIARQDNRERQAQELELMVNHNSTALEVFDNNSVSSQLATFWFIAPIREELLFRFCFFSFLKQSILAFHTLLHGRMKQPLPILTVFGYTPWVFVSSLAFGVVHVTNHVSPLRYIQEDDEIRKNATKKYMLPALAQSTISFVISMRLLSPMFEKHGLAASVGAHCGWNVLMTLVIVPVLGIVRFQLEEVWENSFGPIVERILERMIAQ